MVLLRNAPVYPSFNTAIWLLISLIMVALPHIPRLPFWVAPLLVGLLIWRSFSIYKGVRLPSTSLQFLLALLVLAGILFEYKTLFGRDAGVALLVALCGLKFMEMHSRRDALLLCFLGYFLIITNFLYSQSIPTALYMALVMVVTTGTLISLADITQYFSTAQRLRLSGVLLVQALPIMVLLFILFPRIGGPIWGLPKDAHTGQVGLSESIELGMISELSLSDEIALRVEFADEVPPSSARYWRGPILWHTDGRQWDGGFQRNLENSPIELQTGEQSYTYAVTLEPHNKAWLLALDIPTQAPDGIPSRLQHDYQVLAQRSVRNRIRYELTSYTDYKIDAIPLDQPHTNLRRLQFYLRTALQLPDNMHPKTKALGRQWQEQYQDPKQIVNHALRYFNTEPFFYTFMPPLMLDDPVDQFMFELQRGFCEHYAVAFAILMRAAGIPTRIVTGYLGGRVNSINNMLVVRQRDAHAWNEVWIEGEGWLRVDPTGAVSPERIEQGIDGALSDDFPDLFNDMSNETLGALFQELQDRLDVLNNAWNQWVLGYDRSQQRAVSHWLGLGDLNWRGLTTTLVIGVGLVFLALAAWMLRRNYNRTLDPVQRVYARFCRKLARCGLERAPAEGPLHFAQRVAAERPELTAKTQHITELYIRLRYRDQALERFLPLFRAAVRQFHP